MNDVPANPQSGGPQPATRNPQRHFVSLADHSPRALRHMLDVARRLKTELKSGGRNEALLAGKTLAMIFEKPSLRTRVSFSVAMTQLGGVGLVLRDDEVGLGKREAVQDVARVLSGMCDGIMARTFSHEHVKQLAAHSKVPVINALTDFSHPCQAMADVMTIEEHFGSLAGRTVAYVGDANNVARSLAVACGKFGMRFIAATPPGYAFSAEDVQHIRADAQGVGDGEQGGGGKQSDPANTPALDFRAMNDPKAAVRDADVLVTDTWVSMGQEQEKARRLQDFEGFSLDDDLLKHAPAHAVVLHCLPAYRGLEIAETVLEGPRSLVFAEAENRLHFQKGLLAVLLGGQ